ncbi:MAG: hypothetical protein AB7U46_11220 [Paenirhodobacter sp.]|uniref:hypothetical protein n=1 Tax=Paenirhodobacter sp. TaxID=1965326 RepID=UPI003D13DBCF
MTIAEDAIARAIKRRVLRSAIIKDAKAWEALYGQLQQAMTNAWDDAMREGIASALDRLRDLGPGKFTAEDGASILKVLEGSVGEDAIRAAMRDPVVNLSDALFRLGAEEVGKATGVSIGFMRPDLDALEVLKSGNLYWVGNSWNVNSQNLLAATIEEYFTTGMTREGLAARMAEDFAGVTSRGRVYWEILADHTATKTREMGRVTGYERAGVDRVQVRAHLDAKTTAICRHMHGRIIEVSKMRAQVDSYLAAVSRRNEPAARAAWEMHGASADLGEVPTSKLGSGTAGPPYHFRCRTITVAYFGGVGGLDDVRQKLIDREDIGREARAEVVERAQKAEFLSEKQARAKFQKHRANIPTKKLANFERDARALIADPGATMLLSTRVPLRNSKSKPGDVALHAVFAKPMKNRAGKDGQLVTVLDMEDGPSGRIISHHWRAGQSSDNDVTPATKITKGAIKWLTALLGMR